MTAPTRLLMTHFDTLHRQSFGTAAHFSGAKDANLLAKLWRERQDDPVSVEALMTAFFQHPPQFARDNGFTVGIFYSQIGRLLLEVQRETFQPEDWASECQRLHGGRCISRYTHGLKVRT
jgi:hypothetical protein